MLAHCRNIAAALPAWLVPPYQMLYYCGWFGVDLFFVLSGFLVSGLLFDEHIATGAINIKRFYIRRAFKIVPAFYVLTLITAIYDLVTTHKIVGVHVIHDLLFIQCYRMGAWTHAWTLAVEVHFYILLGLLLWYLSSRAKSATPWLARLPAILWSVMVLAFAARLLNSGLRTEPFNFHRQLQPTHLHLDVLAAGVLLRYYYTYHFEKLEMFTRGKIVWTLVGLELISISVEMWLPHPAWVTALLPTANALGFSLLLFQATQLPFPAAGLGAWLVKPFDYFGKHSYSIYLWHLPVKQWIIDPLMPGPAGLAYFVVFIASSLAVGTFFSEILEMPVLHLRNRLFPSRAALKIPAGSHTVTVPA